MKKNILLILIILTFSCISNSSNNNNDIDIGNEWSIYQGKLSNGYPIIVRKNTWFETKENLLWKKSAGIAFYVLENTENGLPTSSENEKLYILEDKLFKIFEEDKNSAVTLIITAEGVREFILYTKNEELFKNDFESLQILFPDYQLTYFINDDPGWTIYNEY